MSNQTPSIFNQNLGPTTANHQPLTPLTFLEWAQNVYPHKTNASTWRWTPATPSSSTPS